MHCLLPIDSDRCKQPLYPPGYKPTCAMLEKQWTFNSTTGQCVAFCVFSLWWGKGGIWHLCATQGECMQTCVAQGILYSIANRLGAYLNTRFNFNMTIIVYPQIHAASLFILLGLYHVVMCFRNSGHTTNCWAVCGILLPSLWWRERRVWCVCFRTGVHKDLCTQRYYANKSIHHWVISNFI